jgi:hypothetical protein
VSRLKLKSRSCQIWQIIVSCFAASQRKTPGEWPGAKWSCSVRLRAIDMAMHSKGDLSQSGKSPGTVPAAPRLYRLRCKQYQINAKLKVVDRG